MRQERRYALTFEELQGLVAWSLGIKLQSTDIVVLTFAEDAMKGTKVDEQQEPSPPLPYQAQWALRLGE